jgi:small subunit ribosomal protein S20
MRQSRKAQRRNQAYRSRAQTYVKRTVSLIEQQRLDEAEEVCREAVSALDRAAIRGAIHKNNAARRKSRLMTRLNKARAAAAE